jgi:phage terminase small subunit
MATILLKVGQDNIQCVAFKNVADTILKCSDGDQLSVAGSGSINNWKDKDTMQSLKKLPAKQQRFVLEYLVDLNATQAALRAGYAKNTAEKQASRLLGIVGIKLAITERQREIAKRLKITSERVAQEYSVVAFLDFGIFFKDDGTLLPIHEMCSDARAALASIDAVMTGNGEEVVKKIKTYDKLKALNALAKHLGFFEENNKQKQLSFLDHDLHPAIRDMFNNPDKYTPPVDE